jgi:hypothetical protein
VVGNQFYLSEVYEIVQNPKWDWAFQNSLTPTVGLPYVDGPICKEISEFLLYFWNTTK